MNTPQPDQPFNLCPYCHSKLLGPEWQTNPFNPNNRYPYVCGTTITQLKWPVNKVDRGMQCLILQNTKLIDELKKYRAETKSTSGLLIEV